MRDSCRELFRKLEILPLYSQYILSTAIFVIKNKHLFHTNNQIHNIHNIHTRSTISTQDPQYPHKIHNIHTRFTTNLHPPTAQLTKFQKGVYYSAIKIFNNLPHDIKDLANEVIPFRNTLRRILLIYSFYNSDEYFNYKRHSIGH
jgi:hypothetical protein